jgi:hypothetical protein
MTTTSTITDDTLLVLARLKEVFESSGLIFVSIEITRYSSGMTGMRGALKSADNGVIHEAMVPTILSRADIPLKARHVLEPWGSGRRYVVEWQFVLGSVSIAVTAVTRLDSPS